MGTLLVPYQSNKLTCSHKHTLALHTEVDLSDKAISTTRDQARGRLGRNSRPRGRNFALNGTQGEMGVSLKKKKKKKNFFFFFRETQFHSVTTQMQAVVTLSNNLLPLHRVSPSIKWQQYV